MRSLITVLFMAVALCCVPESIAAKTCPGGVCPTVKAPAANAAIVSDKVAAAAVAIAVVYSDKAPTITKGRNTQRTLKRFRSRQPLRMLIRFRWNGSRR